MIEKTNNATEQHADRIVITKKVVICEKNIKSKSIKLRIFSIGSLHPGVILKCARAN